MDHGASTGMAGKDPWKENPLRTGSNLHLISTTAAYLRTKPRGKLSTLTLTTTPTTRRFRAPFHRHPPALDDEDEDEGEGEAAARSFLAQLTATAGPEDCMATIARFLSLHYQTASLAKLIPPPQPSGNMTVN